MSPFWLSIFLDLAADEYAEAVTFWRGATAYELSSVRGEHGEFATLVPLDGDPHLRVQRLLEGESGTHLDLHVDDPERAAAAAEELGATIVARPGHVVLRSPGGYPFCLVTERLSRPAPATRWSDSHRSRADQLCLDIPPSTYDRECDFWSSLTGWEIRRLDDADFDRLMTPPELPVRILLQRCHDEAGVVRGHLDIATDDRPAEIDRLVALGASVGPEHSGWTVTPPPAGPLVCVTDRDPETGLTRPAVLP